MKHNVAKLAPKTNRVPMHWRDTYQICHLLQDEINNAHRLGLQYNKIALYSGIHAKTVSKIASGETKEPRVSTVMSLLRFFNYTITIS